MKIPEKIRREVAEGEWSGPVFTGDSNHPMDGYFSSVEEMRDVLEDDGIPLPSTVYGCTARKLTLNAEHIIENECADHCEEVGEEAWESAPALQKLLDEWCAGLRCATWDEDFGVVVVLAGTVPDA